MSLTAIDLTPVSVPRAPPAPLGAVPDARADSADSATIRKTMPGDMLRRYGALNGQRRHVPAHEHGQRLLRWIQGDTTGAILADSDQTPFVGAILADEVQEAYGEMCAYLGWAEQPWNQAGRYFREALGGQKTYGWFPDADGVRHRLRVYKIPPVQVSRIARSARSAPQRSAVPVSKAA